MTEIAGEKRVVLPWLTVEIALYGVFLCLALALRLGGLEIRIMDVPEADQAWQSWQLAHGGVPEGNYSPLLTSGQALLFFVLGASDRVARLLPALVGSAMVLVPYLARSHLGRAGALASTLILALSPTLVYSARYGGGETLLVAAALGLGALWLAYRQEPRSTYLYAMAVVAALLLLSEPRAIGVILVAGVAWAVERFAFRRTLLDPQPAQSVPWRTLGIVLAGTWVLVATGIAFNPSGIAVWADFPSVWGARFAPVVNGQPWYYPLGALLLYDPFLIVFGAIGAADMLLRRDRASAFLWMALGTLLLALLAGGRDVGDVALVCAFLAILAGRAIDNLVTSWSSHGRFREALFALAALGLTAYVVLQASFYAFALYRSMDKASQFLWFWLLAVALILVLLGLALAWYGAEVTWRIGGTVVAIALLVSAFSATTGLNFRHANDPRELHIGVASDVGTRDALSVLADVSYHKTGYPRSTPITVEAELGPVWLWYLRDWQDIRVVEDLTAQVDTPLVLASADRNRPELGNRYIGQDFVARTWWQSSQLGANEQPRWWLYRKSATQPVSVQKVIVWMQAEEPEN
jgi:4-amino-4-deoxy-L-arabinose transferase-like glycosyltransferase